MNKRNVLGLWLLATFTTGDVPYDSLPASGSDARLALSAPELSLAARLCLTDANQNTGRNILTNGWFSCLCECSHRIRKQW